MTPSQELLTAACQQISPLKRKRDEETTDDQIESDIEAASPKKIQRLSHTTAKRRLDFPGKATTSQDLVSDDNMFTCIFQVTKDVACNLSFTLKENVFRCPELSTLFGAAMQLKIADFAHKTCASSQPYAPEFEVKATDEPSKCVLSYLRGLLTRKEEVAVVPIANSEYQLLIYEKTPFKNIPQAETPEDLFLDEFFDCTVDTTIHAKLIKKFNLVLDLDETLIRTRLAKGAESTEALKSGEYEFYVQDTKYICCVRPGTDMMLKWACSLFNVYIFTNAIYEYAREIAKILDPNRETILSKIDPSNETELRRIVKTREQMTPVEFIPKPLGMKDLSKFSLSLFESVVFDDDLQVWKNKDNVLPFQDITKNKTPKDFFYKMRLETWNKMQHLSKLRMKLRKQKNQQASNSSAPSSPLKSTQTFISAFSQEIVNQCIVKQ